MSWIPGNGKIRFTHAPQPVMVSRGDKKVPLSTVCEEATPPCRLNPLLFNGHLQTMWTAVDKADIPVHYKRHIFEAEETDFAGTFAVDFAVPPFNADRDPSLPDRTAHYKDVEFEALGGDDEKPMLVCLHGLSGGSYEIYLRAVLKPLLDAGWEACVVNGRGCAMTSITTGVLYNARATWDVRQTVNFCRKKWPRRQFFGIGFSLGANIISNYIGEEGENCILKAAVVCSNPWNMESCSLALQRTWLGLEVYSKTMGTNMKTLIAQHTEELSKNSRVDLDAVRKIRYLHEFDRLVQGPTWGYPTEGAYYRDAASVDALHAVRIPLFSINAEDDPIAHIEGIPFEDFKQNPYTVLCSTSLGGHLSWFEVGGTRWFAKPAANFLMAMGAADVEVVPPNWPPHQKREAGVSIAEQAPPYLPMRRKMKLIMDE